MKKLSDFLKTFQSLYVIVASLIGLVFVMLLFIWTFPVPGDSIGKKFTQNISYSVLVFEFGILSAFLTVAFLPMWNTFRELFTKQTIGQNNTYKSKLGIVCLVGSVAFVMSWLFFASLTTLNSPATPASWPQQLNERLAAIYIYIFIVLLPVPLTNLLMYEAIGRKIRNLPSNDNDEEVFFKIANDLLRYRTLLQNGLLTMGIIASAVPITAATLRSIVIVLDKTNEVTFPLIGVIAYGLCFSGILILFYVPTHLMLTQAARVLKNKLCPINNFSDLATNLKRSKDIDEWLHINMSITDNLKTGFFTLAPLITSFIATILGINV